MFRSLLWDYNPLILGVNGLLNMGSYFFESQNDVFKLPNRDINNYKVFIFNYETILNVNVNIEITKTVFNTILELNKQIIIVSNDTINTSLLIKKNLRNLGFNIYKKNDNIKIITPIEITYNYVMNIIKEFVDKYPNKVFNLGIIGNSNLFGYLLTNINGKYHNPNIRFIYLNKTMNMKSNSKCDLLVMGDLEERYKTDELLYNKFIDNVTRFVFQNSDIPILITHKNTGGINQPESIMKEIFDNISKEENNDSMEKKITNNIIYLDNLEYYKLEYIFKKFYDLKLIDSNFKSNVLYVNNNYNRIQEFQNILNIDTCYIHNPFIENDNIKDTENNTTSVINQNNQNNLINTNNFDNFTYVIPDISFLNLNLE
jgi:hypothetical protein